MLRVPWKLCVFQPVAETFQSREVRTDRLISEKSLELRLGGGSRKVYRGAQKYRTASYRAHRMVAGGGAGRERRNPINFEPRARRSSFTCEPRQCSGGGSRWTGGGSYVHGLGRVCLCAFAG